MNIINIRAWHKRRKKYYKVLHLNLNSFEGVWATCKGFDVIEQKEINIQIQPKDCLIEVSINKDKTGKEVYENATFG